MSFGFDYSYKSQNNLSMSQHPPLRADSQPSVPGSSGEFSSNSFGVVGNSMNSSTTTTSQTRQGPTSNPGLYSFTSNTTPSNTIHSPQASSSFSISPNDSRLNNNNINPNANSHHDNMRRTSTSPRPMMDSFLQVNGLVSSDLNHPDLLVNNLTPTNPNNNSSSFNHSVTNNNGNAQVCRYFANGNCMRGDRCNYLHIRSNEPNGIRSPSSSKEEKKKEKSKRFLNGGAGPGNQKANSRRGRGIVPAEAKKPAIDGKPFFFPFFLRLF